MKALWNNQVIAESNDTIVIENNHYFPPSSINEQFFIASDTTSQCPWKGTAHYYSLLIDGEINKDAVWYYPEPKQAAAEIRDYVAFWRGVIITE